MRALWHFRKHLACGQGEADFQTQQRSFGMACHTRLFHSDCFTLLHLESTVAEMKQQKQNQKRATAGKECIHSREESPSLQLLDRAAKGLLARRHHWSRLNGVAGLATCYAMCPPSRPWGGPSGPPSCYALPRAALLVLPGASTE